MLHPEKRTKAQHMTPHLGTAKRPRVEGPERTKGKGGKGKGKSKGKGGSLPGPSPAQGIYPSANMWAYTSGSNVGAERSTPWSNDHQGHQEWIEERMDRLTQMVLRQEQTLSALRQDLMLYLFVRNGEQGMIPVLCQAAEKWRNLKEEAPEKLGYSLKLAMFKQLMITLQERLTETSKSSQAMDHAKSLNWVDPEGCWRILKWNGAKQNLEIDSTVQATSTENLLSQIVQVRKAITETSLIRFKSIRRLTEGVKTEWVTFQIFVSLRQEGSPIWSALTSWIGQAAFHTIGCRLRLRVNRSDDRWEARVSTEQGRQTFSCCHGSPATVDGSLWQHVKAFASNYHVRELLDSTPRMLERHYTFYNLWVRMQNAGASQVFAADCYFGVVAMLLNALPAIEFEHGLDLAQEVFLSAVDMLERNNSTEAANWTIPREPLDRQFPLFLGLQANDCAGAKFRVYVYESQQYSLGSVFCSAGQWGVEVLLHRFFASGSCRTLNADEADLFLVPDYRACHIHLAPNFQHKGLTLLEGDDYHSQVIRNHKDKYRRPEEAESSFLGLIQTLPYFDRKKGMDHIFIFSDQGFIVNFTHTFPSWRDHIPHSIFLTTEAFTPGCGPGCFSPWKDAVIPGHIDLDRMERIRSFNQPSSNRSLLFNFHGRLPVNHDYYEKVGVRRALLQFAELPDVSVGGFIEEYFEVMGKSHFCLVPEGTSSWTNHLYESFFAGCIPLILSDRYVLPFQDLIDWPSISIRWPQEAVSLEMYMYIKELVGKRRPLVEAIKQRVDEHACWFDFYRFDRDCSPYRGVVHDLERRHQNMPKPWVAKCRNLWKSFASLLWQLVPTSAPLDALDIASTASTRDGFPNDSDTSHSGGQQGWRDEEDCDRRTPRAAEEQSQRANAPRRSVDARVCAVARSGAKRLRKRWVSEAGLVGAWTTTMRTTGCMDGSGRRVGHRGDMPVLSGQGRRLVHRFATLCRGRSAKRRRSTLQRRCQIAVSTSPLKVSVRCCGSGAGGYLAWAALAVEMIMEDRTAIMEFVAVIRAPPPPPGVPAGGDMGAPPSTWVGQVEMAGAKFKDMEVTSAAVSLNTRRRREELSSSRPAADGQQRTKHDSAEMFRMVLGTAGFQTMCTDEAGHRRYIFGGKGESGGGPRFSRSAAWPSSSSSGGGLARWWRRTHSIDAGHMEMAVLYADALKMHKAGHVPDGLNPTPRQMDGDMCCAPTERCASLEVFAQLAAFVTFAAHLPQSIVAFIDNTAGQAALSKEYGKDPAVRWTRLHGPHAEILRIFDPEFATTAATDELLMTAQSFRADDTAYCEVESLIGLAGYTDDCGMDEEGQKPRVRPWIDKGVLVSYTFENGSCCMGQGIVSRAYHVLEEYTVLLRDGSKEEVKTERWNRRKPAKKKDENSEPRAQIRPAVEFDG
ncbi:unnamed protein product [Symbiodinium sp. KB8]|nr:unnamed protein product [Symbiodinium sp. KB8]